MSNYAFNYAFNISGNCNAVVEEIAENVGALRRRAEETTASFTNLQQKLIVFNQARDYCQQLQTTVQETLAPGAALNESLAGLSAIAGATGKELETIEKAARRTAKEFGGSAAGSVESYKLLLSQLSPELTKNTEALDAMGRNIAILSKTMNGDSKAAAEVLTTAMNQYGVSLEDPMEASRKMAEMMNIMAAAGREGSAELPTIKAALEQCGMAAKAAGVSFAETNAAIQVLDKAGKKGSEGGVALRNVMSTLAQGRFLPKDVKEELAAAGVSINALTDKSKTLSERLTLLKPVMQDTALFSKLFGKENANAAMALVQGIDTVEKWTDAITGTETAVEQSKIIMETYNEKLARVNASFDDLKISIFNSCGDFGIWVQVVAGALVPVAQLIPLISGLFSGLKTLGTWLVATAKFMRGLTIESIRMKATQLQLHFALITAQLKRTFIEGAKLRALQLHKAFDNVSSKCRNIIFHLLGLDTALATSGGFFTAFKIVAQNACRAIGTAIMNIPIIGWIAAGIAVVIAVVQQLWDKCKGFRIAVFTAWESIKAFGNALMIVFKAVGEAIGSIFGVIKKAVMWVVDIYVTIWKGIFGTIQNIFNEIKSIFARLMAHLSPLFDRVAAIFAGIRAKVTEVAEWITSAFSRAVNAIVGLWGRVVSTVTNVVSSIKTGFSNAVDFVASMPERIANFFTAFADRISAIVSAVRERIAIIAEGIATIFRNVVNAIVGFFTSLVERIRTGLENIAAYWVGIFDSIREAVSAAFEWVVSNVTAIWERLTAIISGFVQNVIAIFANIWNAIAGFAQRVAGIFVNVFNRIKAVFASVRSYISGVVNAIVAKIRSICAPLINAFNTVAGKIKSMFGSVLTWVKTQIDSVINWFIDLYNKIAEALGWDKIKAAGKAAGEKSWAKDHPAPTPSKPTRAATVDADAGIVDPGGLSTPAETGNSGSSSISDGLGSIGGKGDKTDRIKNINITIEKLIDTFTISTTNMHESSERVKDMVAEALVAAVNDANYAL